LRDSDSNISIIKSTYVPQACYVGQTLSVKPVLSEAVIQLPLARVEIMSPYGSGDFILAVASPAQLSFDLLAGNDYFSQVSHTSSHLNENTTIQSMGIRVSPPKNTIIEKAGCEVSDIIPPSVPHVHLCSGQDTWANYGECGDYILSDIAESYISCETRNRSFGGLDKLKAGQLTDNTLSNCRRNATDICDLNHTDFSSITEKFVFKNKLLLRLSLVEGKVIEQIVAPTTVRSRLIKVAYNYVTNGQSDLTRLTNRICAGFWWPEMRSDILAYTEVLGILSFY
jgi:hypothetical protein